MGIRCHLALLLLVSLSACVSAATVPPKASVSPKRSGPPPKSSSPQLTSTTVSAKLSPPQRKSSPPPPKLSTPSPESSPPPASQQAAKAAAMAAIKSLVTPPTAATLLRMAFHDAGTFIKVNRTGGANGSLRFELQAPVSAGLKGGMDLLTKVQAQLVSQNFVVSWADLFQLGGAAGLIATGGPTIDIVMGRKDAVIADANFDGVPHVSTINATTQVAQFAAIGFTTQEMVALLGAHSIGVSANTAPKGPMTKQPNVFGNHYYTELLATGGGHFFSDKALLNDPDTQIYVQMYAANQTLFFQDFTAAYLKLGLDGASFRR